MGGKKPYFAVILIQSMYVGLFMLSKAAFNDGMKSYVFVFYRQAAGTIFLVPLAIILEGKNAPPLSFVTFCKMFMLSLFGITLSFNISGIALVYTSATLVAAICNSLPVITFAFAVLLRMETVTLRTAPGIAKVAGVMVCIAGVMTLAFYKGPYLKPLFHHPLFGFHLIQKHQVHASSGKGWIMGCFLMLISQTFWSLWIVLQGRLLKSYPSKLIFTSLQCVLSAIQSFVVAIAVERNFYQWKLGWNVRLLAVVYCGIVVTGVTFYLQAWVIEKKGPVFQTMSSPLALVITIFCSSFLLGEMVSLGSVLGGILLVGSLYSVLWGKSKEENMNDGGCLSGAAEQECKEVKEVVTTYCQPSSIVM
ncbi:hypothetical protein L1049_002389 [Liquidambar formosana]|uniref:WAT1-related protein n=1 Tax=Liquidambar formosana TaxID=63359 RepID=A0AAP0NFK1_LIQFO